MDTTAGQRERRELPQRALRSNTLPTTLCTQSSRRALVHPRPSFCDIRGHDDRPEPRRARLDTQDYTKPTKAVGDGADDVAFSPDGKQLALLDGGSVSIWDSTGHRELEQFALSHLAGISSGDVVWSPDGRYLAATRLDGVVKLWDLRTGTGTALLHGHPSQSQELAFSPDGTHPASGGSDGTINLWNIITTNPIKQAVLTGHQGQVRDISFSIDSHYLISSSNDSAVRIWSTNGSGEPLVFDEFHARTSAVDAMTDGRRVTAHDDGTIRIWRCPACGPMPKILAAADQHVIRDLTPEERRTYLPADF